MNLAPIAVQVTSSRDEHAHPVVRARNYAVDSGRYSIEVDPADGARIVSFSLDGKNVLVTREDSPEAYGSSFWPSPQSDWSWPPPLEIDKRPWHVSAKKNALELESAVNPALGLSVKQRITLDGTRGVATITYTLENHGSAPRKVAPWQNSRTRPGGLTFYASDTPSTPESDLKLEPQKGVIWFLHDPSKFTKGVKSFSDGKGWLAHVDGDLLFVKVFPDLPPGAQAPKEAEIELYVDGAGRFVEVEQQGAYVELPPGGHSTWTVHWLVEQLPASVEPSLGNAALVAHAQAMAARVQR
ncbi:MAG TPA: hypothetical protein VGI10_14325 [Polyangiaceae bacterium]